MDVATADKNIMNTTNTECAICSDDISAVTGRTIMGCGHEFHTKCLVQWLQKPDGTGSCPYCRKAPGEMERLVCPQDEEDAEDEEDEEDELLGVSNITPLMRAARERNLDEVRNLLDAGADVDAKDSDGDTALQWAEDDACRSFLMQRGADIHCIRTSCHPFDAPRNKHTALMAACEMDSILCVRALLDLDADPNYADPSTGITPLLETIRSEASPQILALLIEHGANIFHVDKMDMNAFLWMADVGGDPETMSILLKAAGHQFHPPTVARATKIQSAWRRFAVRRTYSAARILTSFL